MMSVLCCQRIIKLAHLQRNIVRALKLPTSSYSQRTIEKSKVPLDNLTLRDFLVVGQNLPKATVIEQDILPPYLRSLDVSGNGRKVFFDVYGCQMNFNDTEVVWSILKAQGYQKTQELKEADVILIVTCSIREGAETKIWNRLVHLKALRKGRSKKAGPLQIGLLGCMAERLKAQIIERESGIDVVSGPDSYRDLPRLLALTKTGQSAINVLLSLDETYSDVMPVKLDQNSINAYVTIMRGCDNMCSYCIVPFTRGKERSRPIPSIEREVKHLVSQGVKEVTLLGQNVNSYRDTSKDEQYDAIQEMTITTVAGFKTVYKQKIGGVRFAELLERVAAECPELRIRFTSPHPKDFPAKVIDIIAKYPNICKSLHLPAQSGSSSVLERMRRGYSREAYLELVRQIRLKLPQVALSSDFICGFCGETEEEFQQTLTLLDEVKYNVGYLFPYSMREKTTAHRRFQDDVPHDIKIDRLNRMVEVYRKNAKIINEGYIGQKQLILIEGSSKKKPDDQVFGRNDFNIKVIVPRSFGGHFLKNGDYVAVRILDANSQVLQGMPLEITTLQEFNKQDDVK